MVPKHDDRSFFEKILPKSLADLFGYEPTDVSTLPNSAIKAFKCDLCVGKDGVPACVGSCPTGAAQRVDPIEHFLKR